MAIRPGAFDLRTMPRLGSIEPADFDSGIAGANAAFRGVIQNAGSIEDLRTAQRAGEIAAATQDARKRIATMQATEAVTTEPQQARIRALKSQIAELEGGEAVATHEQQAHLRALKSQLAELQTAGSITAEPEIQQIEGMKRAEAVETFPAQRARREAETTRGTSAAQTGTEAEDQKRAGLEATRNENVRIAKTGAAAEIQKNQTEAFRQGGAAARYANEPKLTHIIEDDTGTYRETYVDLGDRKIVLNREQIETPSQRTTKSQQSQATLEATRALANQRNRPGRGNQPMAVRDRHGATVGFVHAVTDPDTGEVTDYEFRGIGEGAPGAVRTGSPVSTATKGSTDAAATPTTATPAASTATAAAPPAVTHIPNAKQIALLQSQPALAAQFDEMFGQGAAARVLGGK